MKKRTLLQATLGLALMLSLPQAAHAEDALARVKAAGVLKVGTETAFAPFDFIDEAGEHVGLNVDAFEEIGKELGVKIEWTELPWDGVFPALEAGQFDIVAGPATITKARTERYRFLSPVAEATVAILKGAKDETIQKPEDIAGKVVGAGKATSQLAQVQAFGKTLPQPVETREYPGFNEAYADLATGRIAAVANSLPNIAYVASKQPDTFAVVEPAFGQKSYFGFIGTKKADDQPLLDAVQAALVKIKGDGRMKTLQEKWFGTSFDTPDVAPEPAF
ncbi:MULTISPECIES: transporter substrate-binding domain-containing protein [unclassified Aureimonas]|uniref:transporter substrate-binding domain-containing protein n=1 Tax=unclassified Aureimonas TaxID=2615206 RepID=UPI0006F60185|nr:MULTISPECIES: transporter substrate-binding domain-containing protein [unclassified Aureimonas]KQT69103.1 amino acid ABC transporter [Aureimonas sp. Leaf460]KQT69337.1 amino acid ABC transporter [Aureimonas sp. Leaf427]